MEVDGGGCGRAASASEKTALNYKVITTAQIGAPR